MQSCILASHWSQVPASDHEVDVVVLLADFNALYRRVPRQEARERMVSSVLAVLAPPDAEQLFESIMDDLKTAALRAHQDLAQIDAVFAALDGAHPVGTCGVCLDAGATVRPSACSHGLCAACMREVLRRFGTCPSCRGLVCRIATIQ